MTYPKTSIKMPCKIKGQLISLLILLLCTTLLNGQGWRTTLHTTTDEFGLCVVTVDDGHVVGGERMGFFYMAKVDTFGVFQWERSFGDSLASEALCEMVATPDGGFAAVGDSEGAGLWKGTVFKFDSLGVLEWELTRDSSLLRNIAATPDGGYIAGGILIPYSYPFIVKVAPDGTKEWEQIYDSIPSEDTAIEGIIANDDGSYVALGGPYNNPSYLLFLDPDGTLQSYKPNTAMARNFARTHDGGYLLHGFHLQKVDAQGNNVWQRTIEDQVAEAVVGNADGSFILASKFIHDRRVLKIDSLGNILWERIIDGESFVNLSDIAKTSDGGFLISGSERHTNVGSPPSFSVLLIKLNGNGSLYGNFLKGNVYYDLDENCSLDPAEAGLANWMVKASGQDDFYDITDADGNYFIDVPVDTFVLSAQAADALLWESCLPFDTLVVNPGIDDTLYTDIAQQALVYCPLLTVDLSVPFLRRCFENTYTVSYGNGGTATATDAYVMVTLDPFLQVTGSSLPWSSQVGNTFTFELGDVPLGGFGSFTIDVELSCAAVLGQTHCTEAHIFPDAPCLPSDGSWDGSITDVRVECLPDSVVFTIQNIGLSDMAVPLEYYVVEDNLIMKTGTFQLPSGSQQMIGVPANGSTYRIYAEQALGHFPDDYIPTVALEGCGFDPVTNQFSLGFITQFGEDDDLPYFSIDCQQNIGSYDPNDKRAEPAGIGEVHYITRSDDLDYHIRFQNTGSDTAFTVVIRDTLSEFLDIASLRLGARSHDYAVEIEEGRVLVFTFNDILLPDSITNEAASHGFVKFRIDQLDGLPLETVVYNRADIYFDFNAPVSTNKTYHSISENHASINVILDVETIDHPLLMISVRPNPFSDFADFRVEGVTGRKQFRLFDAMGRLLQEQAFDGNDYRFYGKGLGTGLYFYTISGRDGLLGSGKLLLR